MGRLYSPATGCTYLKSIHGNAIPKDAVEIPEELYIKVIASENPGKMRAHGADGLPYLVDVVVSPEQAAADARAWRARMIESVKWLRERHRDEVDIGGDTTLTGAEFSSLLSYVQGLRDWPDAAGFPAENTKPSVPKWLSALGIIT